MWTILAHNNLALCGALEPAEIWRDSKRFSTNFNVERRHKFCPLTGLPPVQALREPLEVEDLAPITPTLESPASPEA